MKKFVKYTALAAAVAVGYRYLREQKAKKEELKRQLPVLNTETHLSASEVQKLKVELHVVFQSFAANTVIQGYHELRLNPKEKQVWKQYCADYQLQFLENEEGLIVMKSLPKDVQIAFDDVLEIHHLCQSFGGEYRGWKFEKHQ